MHHDSPKKGQPAFIRQPSSKLPATFDGTNLTQATGQSWFASRYIQLAGLKVLTLTRQLWVDADGK